MRLSPITRRIAFLGMIVSSLAIAATASAQTIDKYRKIAFSNVAPGEVDHEDEILHNMPVKIMMESETGKPYAGVYMRIFNASGVAVFQQMCEKPWLYLNLTPGDYHAIGVDRKKITRIKAFRVKPAVEDVQPQAKVSLKWPKKSVGY